MKLFVAMVSLTLFVGVLRSPASSAIGSTDVGDLLRNRPTASPSATPSAVAVSPTPTPAPDPTATPAPTLVRSATPPPVPRCTTQCQIRGRVTIASTGGAAPGTHVNVYRSPENFIVGSVTSDANGNYTFTVAAGNYKVFFNPSSTTLVAQWYAGKSSLSSANVV